MSTYYYVPHQDIFRQGLIRCIGYAYPIMDMFYWDERDYRENSWFYIATAGFIGCHTLFHLALGISDASDPGMSPCPVANRMLYAAASGVETFIWEAIATVLGPYVVGNFVNMFMRSLLVTNAPPEDDGVRGMRHVPRIMAAVSIPVCGFLFIDRVADLLVSSIGIKSSIFCPQEKLTTRFMIY